MSQELFDRYVQPIIEQYQKELDAELIEFAKEAHKKGLLFFEYKDFMGRIHKIDTLSVIAVLGEGQND